MPSDYYLALAGVVGETQAAEMNNCIELHSWSFGATSPPDLRGKGLSAGRPSFSDFTFSFVLDSSSYQILKNLCQGTHIASATFTGRKTGGGAHPYTYLVVALTKCFVSAFSTAGDSQGVPCAHVAVAYEAIKFQYYIQNTVDGSVSLAGQSQYDVKQVEAS